MRRRMFGLLTTKREATLDESLDVKTLSEHGKPYRVIQTPVSDYLQEQGFEIAQGESELDHILHFSHSKRLLRLQFETTGTKEVTRLMC